MSSSQLSMRDLTNQIADLLERYLKLRTHHSINKSEDSGDPPVASIHPSYNSHHSLLCDFELSPPSA